ncbi:hypothetical protein SEA_ANON_74 [Gordonia phage Anon]|nr:hypothetical protein SEA_ANON_74 [Gordonia phage Anon]
MSVYANTTTETFKAGKYTVVAPNQALSGSGTNFEIGQVVILRSDQFPDGEGDLYVSDLDEDKHGYVHFESLVPGEPPQVQLRDIISRLEGLEARIIAATEPEETKVEFTSQGIYRTDRGHFVVKDNLNRTFFTTREGGWISVDTGEYDDVIVEKIELSSL